MLASSAMLCLSENRSWQRALALYKRMVRTPTQRMLMGLVEYTANFLVADYLNLVLPNFSVLSSLFIIILLRFQFVLKIIVRQCTASLVRNGQNSTMGPCDVLHNLQMFLTLMQEKLCKSSLSLSLSPHVYSVVHIHVVPWYMYIMYANYNNL